MVLQEWHLVHRHYVHSTLLALSNATPHSKMSARTHKPLPSDGWQSEYRDGPWKDYVERCVHEGAHVGNEYVYGECIEWLNDNGVYHREDGPSIEYQNGYKVWWVNGHLHRLDGPAKVLVDGSKDWWVNGQLHRLDGPAIERTNGTVQFWKEGVMYMDITFTRRY